MLANTRCGTVPPSSLRECASRTHGRLTQSGRLDNPELEFEYAKNVHSSENSFAGALMQRFPVTARLRLERAVSSAELAAAEAEVRNEERKVAGEARIAAVKVLALHAQRALRERQLGNSRELAEFSRKRVQSGEGSLVEATQVELELAQLQSELLVLEAEEAAMLGELRALIGAAPTDSIIVGGELPAIAALPARGVDLKRRADFVAAQHKTEAARRVAALARAQRFDDIGLGVIVEREYFEDAPDGLMREVMAGVRVSVPLPLFNRNQGRIQEAAAAEIRAEREVDALAITIRAEASAAGEQMRTFAKLVSALTDEILPKAAQVEEQLRNAYTTGQSPLTEVLRARDKRLLLDRQRLDALRDYHLAQTRYAIATGRLTPIARNRAPGK